MILDIVIAVTLLFISVNKFEDWNVGLMMEKILINIFSMAENI